MKPKQSIPKELRYTVADFNAEFPNDDSCLEHIKEQRWPDGVTQCEKCGVERKHYRVSGRTAYACDHCGNHIYPLAGTVFEKTTTLLKTWFYAMYLMGSTRCGISAKQIQRETGVTYKTAWRMVRVVARVAPNATRNTLHGLAKEYILPSSTVFTDDYVSYDGLEQHGYVHKRIRHSAKIYVSGDIHTQTIEGFWSLVKRGIGGVYHNVSAKYLQTYLNEYSFRFNRRDSGNLLFKLILARVSQLAS